MTRLSKGDILGAFAELSLEVAGPVEPHEIVIGGGAAMVLLYDARESTRDVDAVFVDRTVIKAGEAVAMRLGLPIDWLNDAAKGYLRGLTFGTIVFSSPSLIVRTLAVPQLLAMKLSAWRDDVDIGDGRILLADLSGSKEEVWALLEDHLMTGRELKARYAFEDLWESKHGTA